MAVPAKLLPASMKVGRVPVVRPLSLWSVVVGGSAMKGRRKALFGERTAVSYMKGKALWKGALSSAGTVKS